MAEAASAQPRPQYPVEFIERELQVVMPIAGFSSPKPAEWPGTVRISEAGRHFVSADEKEYLQSAAEGNNVREIATKKHRTDATVRKSLNAMRGRYSLPNLTAAVRFVFEKGILTAEPQELPADRQLTSDEYRVFDLLSRGKTAKEVEKEIPEVTGMVSIVRQAAITKLGGKNINHAVMRAYELGVFTPNPGLAAAPKADQSELLLVTPRAEASPLSAPQTVLVDGVSRAVSLSRLADQCAIDRNAALKECQGIVQILGATSLTQAVDISIRRGLIPVRRDIRNSSPNMRLQGTSLDIARGTVRHGLSSKETMRLMGGITSTTYLEQRAHALRAAQAVTYPHLARRLHEINQAA